VWEEPQRSLRSREHHVWGRAEAGEKKSRHAEKRPSDQGRRGYQHKGKGDEEDKVPERRKRVGKRGGGSTKAGKYSNVKKKVFKNERRTQRKTRKPVGFLLLSKPETIGEENARRGKVCRRKKK